MLRSLIRAVVLLIGVIAILVGVWAFLGYRWSGDREADRGAIATSGRAETARERGAEIGAAVGSAAARLGDAVSDGAITAKIKSKMALDDTIKARDIKVSTKDAVVTLSGQVGSAAERDRAVQLARETEGVKSVTDHLQLPK